MSSPESSREQWLGELSEFIVEANQNTWAADGAEVEPQRPGHKELEYKNGLWLLRDSYTGYFRAPGMTTVYHKDMPVWTMTYGGTGQAEKFYDVTKDTFEFLKSALMHVTAEMPIRGPEFYTEDEDGNPCYTFNMGGTSDLTNGHWQEKIYRDGNVVFEQRGDVGIVIHKNADRMPVYPWQL